jgi:hypothetical protein
MLICQVLAAEMELTEPRTPPQRQHLLKTVEGMLVEHGSN